jgi:hypothetical protein
MNDGIKLIDLVLEPEYHISGVSSLEETTKKFSEAQKAIQLLGESYFTVRTYQEDDLEIVNEDKISVEVSQDEDREYVIRPDTNHYVSQFTIGKLPGVERDIHVKIINGYGNVEAEMQGKDLTGRLSLDAPHKRSIELTINGTEYVILNGCNDRPIEEYY